MLDFLKKSFATSNIKVLFFFLFMIGFFWSCSKEESGNSLRGKIYMKIQNPGRPSADTTEFEYDENGRIKAVSRQFHVFNETQTLTFTRNSSGQTTSLNDRSNASYYTNVLVNYSIGTDGKYISALITLMHGSSSSQRNDIFTYTGNRITQIDRQSYDHHWKSNYFYDERGNVIKITKSDATDSLLQAEFTYNNILNPVESIVDPYSIEDISLSSYNNPSAAKYYEAEGPVYILHTYTFNEQGKPLTDITSLSYDSINSYDWRTTQFIYY